MLEQTYLVPLAVVALNVAVADLAHEHDHLGNHHLRHRTSVREGSVQHNLAERGGGGEIGLVGTDAEAADGEEAS